MHYWSLVMDLGKDLLKAELDLARGHGSELSVALALAIRPDLVFSDKFSTWVPKSRLSDKYPEVMICAPFTETTPTGHVGDPSRATAEQGREVLRRVIERIEGFLREWD